MVNFAPAECWNRVQAPAEPSGRHTPRTRSIQQCDRPTPTHGLAQLAATTYRPPDPRPWGHGSSVHPHYELTLARLAAPSAFESRRGPNSIMEYTKQECIEELQAAAQEFGEPLFVREYREGDYTPSDRTLAKKFGSWNDAKRAAGLDVITHGKNTARGQYHRAGCALRINDSGYMVWRVHDHPTCRDVFVHRLQAVAELGIDATRGKHVHHVNEIPWDNRIDNLELMTPAEHGRHHASQREDATGDNLA